MLKSHIKILNLNDQLRHGMKSLNCLMDKILCQILKIILTKKSIGNPSVKIYINNIENRITFKTKTEYYLELLTLEAMTLFGST